MTSNSHLQKQRSTLCETEFSGPPIASLSTGTPQCTPGMQRLFQNYPSSSHTTTPSLLNCSSQNTNLTEASLTNCFDPQQLTIQQRTEQPASNTPNDQLSSTPIAPYLSEPTTSFRPSVGSISQIMLSMPSSTVNTQCAGSIGLATASGEQNVTVIPFTIGQPVNSQQQSTGLLSSGILGSSFLQCERPRNTTFSLPSSVPNALRQTNVNVASSLNALAEATVERGPISQEEQSANDAFNLDEPHSNLQVSKRHSERESLRTLKTNFFNILEDK